MLLSFQFFFPPDYVADVFSSTGANGDPIFTSISQSVGPCANDAQTSAFKILETPNQIGPVTLLNEFEGPVRFEQPFCIAMTITIPDATDTVLMHISDGFQNTPFATLFVRRDRVALIYANGLEADFTLASDITTTTTDYAHIQICVENDQASLYIGCIMRSQSALVNPPVAAITSTITFFQRSATNTTQQFRVS